MTREEFEDAHSWLAGEYTSAHWNRIDAWIFPTKDNNMRSQVYYHVCDGNRKTADHIVKGSANISLRLDPDECKACGAKVPDGLKMVVMLLEMP
jgi:hypothetical protein